MEQAYLGEKRGMLLRNSLESFLGVVANPAQ